MKRTAVSSDDMTSGRWAILDEKPRPLMLSIRQKIRTTDTAAPASRLGDCLILIHTIHKPSSRIRAPKRKWGDSAPATSYAMNPRSAILQIALSHFLSKAATTEVNPIDASENTTKDGKRK